jgi:uncharacterized membrane protein
MDTFFQWVHLSAAVVGVGGMAFLLWVLFPAASTLSVEQRNQVLREVFGRFRWITWGVMVLLLASGLYNVRLVWFVPWGRYWQFLTLKIILAFIVFGITLLLTLPVNLFKWFGARRELWLGIAFTLAMVVILISAYLRRG